LLVESTGLVNKDFHTTKKAVLVSGQMKHFLAVLAIVFGAAKLEKRQSVRLPPEFLWLGISAISATKLPVCSPPGTLCNDFELSSSEFKASKIAA
jgi:hypothetical protein